MYRTALLLCVTAIGSASATAQVVRDGSELPAYEPGREARNGYTAQDLFNAELRGIGGGTIGEIEDLVIGPDGQLRRLLVDINEGLFGTGGQRLAVQWTDVRPGPRKDGDVQYFTTPVSKQNVKEYGVFSNRPAAVQGLGREWRAGELIGDYVSLEDVANYGSVVDLVFDRQGRLLSIALAPDISRGDVMRRFYSSYYGSDPGWDPGDDFIVLPYSTTEVNEMIPNQGRSREAP